MLGNPVKTLFTRYIDTHQTGENPCFKCFGKSKRIRAEQLKSNLGDRFSQYLYGRPSAINSYFSSTSYNKAEFMGQNIPTTTTVHPLHFEDLSGHQFERLVFSFVHGLKKWDKLEWLGQVGSDGGRDIWGEYGGQTICYQCVNYRVLSLKKIKADIDKLVSIGAIPNSFIVMAGGMVGAHTRDVIRNYAFLKGIYETRVYSGTELEMEMRAVAPELIKRFFEGETFPTKKTSTRIIGVPFKTSMIFEGRDGVLDELIEILTGGGNIVLSASVEGLGGIGKTELVLHLIHKKKISDHFRFIIWIDGAAAIEDQWYKVAEIVQSGLTSSNFKTNLERIESFLFQEGNSLIIVDNAHKWHEIQDLIPTRIPLLVTTRTHDFGGNTFIHKQIEFLSEDAAIKILTAIVPTIENDKHLPDLLDRLGGHALAIEMAGLCIRTMRLSVAGYLHRLSRFENEPAIVVEQTKHLKTVRACLLATWDQVSKPSQQLWIYASMFAPTSTRQSMLRELFIGFTDKDIELVDILNGEPENSKASINALLMHRKVSFEELFAELCMYGILTRVNEEHGDISWNMHRIVRDFTYDFTLRFHRICFAFNFSEWLKHQAVIDQGDLPHVVNSTLESFKYLGNLKSAGGDRNFASEISHLGFPGRINDILFDPMRLFRFIENQLNAAAIVPILRDGLKNPNPAVVNQSLLFLLHAPHSAQFVPPLFECLVSSDYEISSKSEMHLADIASARLFPEEMMLEISRLLNSKTWEKQSKATSLIRRSRARGYWSSELYVVLEAIRPAFSSKYAITDLLISLNLIEPNIQVTEQLVEIVNKPVIRAMDVSEVLNSIDCECLSKPVASFLLKVFENDSGNNDEILNLFISSNKKGLEACYWFLLDNCYKCNFILVDQLLEKMKLSETNEYRRSVLGYFCDDTPKYRGKGALVQYITEQMNPDGVDILLNVLCNSHYSFQPILNALEGFVNPANRQKIGLAILDTYIQAKQAAIFLVPLLKALVKFECTVAVPSLRLRLITASSSEVNDIKETISQLGNLGR